MSLGWCPEEWAFSETKGAFTSWACPLQEFYPLCGVKLRKEPLAEKLVIPQVPKGSQGCENCLIQQGVEHQLLAGHRRSLVPHGDSPSPVFSLCSWCFFWWEEWAVTAGWIHHSCSWTLWRLENPHPSIELNITGSCGLCGISTAWGCSRMPFLWEKKYSAFWGKYCRCRLKSSSHVWIGPVCGLGLFYNVCAASRDNVSFWETLDGFCGRNFFYPVMDMLQWMRMLLGAAEEWWWHFGAL